MRRTPVGYSTAQVTLALGQSGRAQLGGRDGDGGQRHRHLNNVMLASRVGYPLGRQ